MKKLLFTIFPLIFITCSSVKNNEPELIYELSDIFAWVDLMPGGEPGFHITGRLDIYTSGNNETPQLSKLEIAVYQDEKNIYSFIPKLEYSSKQKEGIKAHLFTFFPQNRLPVKKLDFEKHISIKCGFYLNGNSYSALIDSILVNKVY